MGNKMTQWSAASDEGGGGKYAGVHEDWMSRSSKYMTEGR